MDVIVIGCGASGVAALRKLHDAGLDVLGLEAADRIGGRINTVQFGDSTIDVGAAWCHGEKDNVVFELVNPLDLLGRPDVHDSWYVVSNGDLAPNETSEEIIQTLENHVYGADKSSSISISECVRNAANTNDTLKKHPNYTKWFTELYERLNHLGGQNDPKTGKSLKGLKEQWICEGEFMLNWKGRGYKTIFDVLLNKYPDPSKEIPAQILLNKEVESIRWGTSQPVDASNPLVQVKCKDGSLYAAKSVIVTVSLGVLKERHTQLFNPPLPKEKVNAINNLQQCVLDKIYVEFTEAWWPKSPAKFTILWREEDKAKYSDEEKWITEIYAFETVQHQPNVLLTWIYGNGAEMMESVSVEEVKKGVEKLLENALKKSFDVTPVKTILRSQWASNPLTRGAYSYRSVATEQNNGSAVVLSEPLYHSDGFPVVCFAGEATSHHRHSAVHGAVEAGYREAQRLIDGLDKLKM